jgi:hypothetical protein
MMRVSDNKPQRDRPLPVRISAEQIERADRLRGLVPRERYIRHLLDRALDQAEERDRDREGAR